MKLLGPTAIVTNPPRSLLSYGCSSGEEIETLLSLFPTAVQIIGVDIDKQKLALATERFKNEPRVTIVSADHFVKNYSSMCFDFLTCFNVLCNFYSVFNADGTTYDNRPIDYALFEGCIKQLASQIAPGGILCVYGANYSVNSIVDLPSNIVAKHIAIDCGRVPMFLPDGKTPLPRNPENIYALLNITKSSLPPPSPEIKQETASTVFSLHTSVKCNATILPNMPRITIGLLHPGIQSNNLGDYIQTLAQLNVWSVFYNPDTWHASSGIHRVLQHFARTKPNGNCVRQKLHPCLVDVVWVDRDNCCRDSGTIIHVIANGWFMHAKTDDCGMYQFPFPPNIKPIFVSMHIAYPEILDQVGVKEYLQLHAPIGCRDISTMKLMLHHNIPAYFSSCLTTSLESALSLTNSTSFSYLELDVLSNTGTHHVPEKMKSMNLEQKIELALQELMQYANADAITSRRIHCLLPTRAISEKPSLFFCSSSGGTDGSWTQRSRFSGLVEVMDDPLQRELAALVLFEDLVQQVHNILFLGLKTNKTKMECLDLSHMNDISHIAPRDLRLRHPATLRVSQTLLPDVTAAMLRFCKCSQTKILPEKLHVRDFVLRKCPFQAFDFAMDIVVTFDINYVQVFQTFLAHVSTSNLNGLLRIWCLTRGILVSSFVPLLKKCPFNVVLEHIMMDEQAAFENYRSPLKHVTQICLDRVLLDRIAFKLDVERIIYLDLDIAVVGSLKPLLFLDSGTKGIAAKTSIVDNVIPSWLHKYQQDSSTKLEYKHDKSFNAGVMVMDVSKIRRNKMSDFCLDMYEKHGGINDQMLLNFYCAGKYKELPGQYNCFVGQDHTQYSMMPGLISSAVAFHYVGSQKPWLAKDAMSYQYGKEMYELWHKFDLRKKIRHIPG